MFTRILTVFASLALAVSAAPETPPQISKEVLAPLLDPVKVKALKGDRPANPRLYRVLYWLETARQAGGEPGKVIEEAQVIAGYAGTLAAIPFC